MAIDAWIEYTDRLLIQALSIQGDGHTNPLPENGTDYWVAEGEDLDIQFIPDTGNHIYLLFIDGEYVLVGNNPADWHYLFEDVREDHRFEVMFSSNYSVTVIIGEASMQNLGGGTDPIAPNGDSPVYDLTPAEGYHLTRVIIDGVDLQAPFPGSCQFLNVTVNHSLEVATEAD